MAVETILTRTGRVVVDNGTDTQGNAKTANVSVSGLSKDNWDADKFLNIAAALEPCLANSLHHVEGGTTFSIRAS